MRIIKHIEINKAQQKNFLLCFISLLSTLTFGQIRFIKIIKGPENYAEYTNKVVELKDCYLIPIQSLATVAGDDIFYILKLNKNGKVINRTNFSNWDEDRGPLIKVDENTFWKVTVKGDTLNHYYYFSFQLFDSGINEILSVDVPRTHRQNALISNDNNYIKLSNGDFIFMLYVVAMNWAPFTGYVSGVNYIYISRTGKISANKTVNNFHILDNRFGNNIWQINDTSILSIVYGKNCGQNCIMAKKFNLDGTELFSKAIPFEGLNVFKKCGNKYYAMRRWQPMFEPWQYSILCFNEDFDLLYEKKIPLHINPRGFWDNSDNNDFRVRTSFCVPDINGDPTDTCYETMMDTSFTWQKLKLPNGEEEILTGLKGDEPDFYPTTDGGALYVFEKTLKIDYDQDLVFVKVDTNWVEKSQPQEEESLTYPNPNNSNFMVIKKEGWQTAAIYDLAGRLLFKHEYNLLNYLDGINIQDLRPGNYFLQIVFPDKVVINRFIRY